MASRGHRSTESYHASNTAFVSCGCWQQHCVHNGIGQTQAVTGTKDGNKNQSLANANESKGTRKNNKHLTTSTSKPPRTPFCKGYSAEGGIGLALECPLPLPTNTHQSWYISLFDARRLFQYGVSFCANRFPYRKISPCTDFSSPWAFFQL